jgi:acetolactate synthase I/II/III large subunit
VRGTETIAAETLVDAIRTGGADTIFGMPGGGPNLALIGAAEAVGLRFVLTHGETAGAITAATYGLLTGAPATAISTRGPGAASAVNGVAQATLDRFPLLFVSDCVPAHDTDRVAHQRLDQMALMAPVTKGAGRLGGDAAAADVASSAVALAGAAPRGAVHLDFDPGAASIQPGEPAAQPSVDPAGLDRARSLIADSDRPVVIVGIGAVDDAARVRDVLERLSCPVLTTYQAAGVLPDGHPQLAGLYTGGVLERPMLAAADLIVAVGLDTVEPIPAPWGLDVPVVSIDIAAPASTFLPADVALVGASVGELLDRVAEGAGHRWANDAGAAALAVARDALLATSAGTFGPVELANVVVRCAPGASTATVDAGAHFLAIMPFWPAAAPLRVLISNGLATMGFALPAAIGAALARPGTPVVCMVGDGGLGMTLAELETVARLRLPITVVVFDDAALSLIEIKQRDGQGGAGAVRYAPVDFAAVAVAMGLAATTVDSVEGLERALDGGWDRPRLVDARIDPTSYPALLRTTRG